MKNKIFAILMILCICLSMIPINALAAGTSETATIEWEKSTIKGTTYKIEYWHPKGYDKIMIYDLSGSSYRKNYYFVYYNDETEFGTYRSYLLNGSVITTSQLSRDNPDYTFAQLEADTGALLFAEDASLRNNTFTKYASDGTTYKYMGYDNVESMRLITSDDAEFETYFADWYYNTYGLYPPLIAEDEEVEYMKGNYYAILKQPLKIQGNGTSFDGIPTSAWGNVETCTNVMLESQDGIYVYVVVSTNTASGDFLSLARNTFWQYIGVAIEEFWNALWGNATVSKMYDLVYAEGEQGPHRNGYDLVGENQITSMFYSDTEYLNRYYFKNLDEAAKFVLYGTAGAKYQHKEEGQTHYGYGYADVVYNNYDINGFGLTPVPNNQYPLERGQVIIRWHQENVAEREYLMITFNYFPFASVYSTSHKMTIAQKLEPEYYVAYETEENTETFDPRDFTQYTKTNKYDFPSIQHFQMYHKDLGEIYKTNSWDFIWSSHSIYAFKQTIDENGNIIIESGSIYEDDPIIETMKDLDGKKVIYDSLNDQYIKEGEEKDPYIYDKEKDGYFNSKGEQIFPDNLTSDMGNWRDSLKKYMSSIDSASQIIEDFTDIINGATDDMKELTALLNAFLKQMVPSPIKTFIGLFIFALIIMRITRRA